MKAWQFTGTNQPLELNDVPQPTAAEGQVVVDVKAAGISQADVATLDEPGWSSLFRHGLPRTLGHETAGVISEVGAGMDHWKVGDRVGLAPLMDDGDALGYGKWDGGFAPQLIATDQNLVALPDEVPYDLGALATEAGVAAYHAMMTEGQAGAGMKVGVIGLGGLGYIGARCAVLAGAEVYGAEVNPEAQKLAEELELAGIADSIDEFMDKKLELIVDYAGFGRTTASALETLVDRGMLVQVGMGRLEAKISIYPLIVRQLTIKGSKSGTKQDLAGIYELMRTGKIRPPMNHITHAQIPGAIDALRAGGVIGRFIAQYD